ncbi:MAG: pilus assembly protein TadG-related protein, partial [Hyphomonadaceae bacterium]
MITGLIAVPVAMIVVITIEMVSLSSEKARMQAAVDAAALAGAREMAVAGGTARNANGFAETFAMNQVVDLAPRIAMNFTANLNSTGGFEVAGVGVR